MRFVSGLLVAGLLACVLPWSVHAADEVDRSFGEAGFAMFGFQPSPGVPNGGNDRAILACSGPAGTLLVSGIASADRRIVTIRITETGELDGPDFGVDGKASFPITGGLASGATGVCQPDGKLVLAYEAYDPVSGEGNLRIVRIDPNTGMPDTSFGTSGTAAIDLDHYGLNLGVLENPTALSISQTGDLYLGGYTAVDPAGPYSEHKGFLARVDGQGIVQAVRLEQQLQGSISNMSSAVLSPDGNLWVAATHFPSGGTHNTRILQMNPVTLELVDGGLLIAQLGTGIYPMRGALRPDGSFVLSGQRGHHSVIATVRGSAHQLLELPFSMNASQAAQLPDGSLLLGGADESGFGFVRVREASNGRLGVDVAYGSGGRAGGPIPARPACPTQRSSNTFGRFTLWRGRPTVVGATDRSCDASQFELDYVIHRLHAPGFGSGFE